MQEETREKLMRMFDWGKRFLHFGFIPLIVYLGKELPNGVSDYL